MVKLTVATSKSLKQCKKRHLRINILGLGSDTTVINHASFNLSCLTVRLGLSRTNPKKRGFVLNWRKKVIVTASK